MSTKYLVKNKKKISLKTRYYKDNNQLFRIDDEDTRIIDDLTIDNLINIFKDILENFNIDAIVISDYNKGLCADKLLEKIIKISNEKNIQTFIDPKIRNIKKYKGAYLLKPNRLEYQQICNYFSLNCNHEVETLNMICEYLDLNILVITLDKDGTIVYNNSEKTIKKFSAKKTSNVLDVTGAGDTFMSVLVNYINLDEIDKIIEYCNKVCLYSITKLGNIDLNLNDLNRILNIKEKYLYDNFKINNIISQYQGKKIVFTNGCFDILHLGHIHYLKKCKSLGDILIVGLNSDISVKMIKGDNRPINNENYRADMLLSYEFIDIVVIFDEKTPYNLIKNVLPDILVKGGDYKIDQIIGREFETKVKTIEYLENYSSTNIINTIKNT